MLSGHTELVTTVFDGAVENIFIFAENSSGPRSAVA